MRVMCGSSIVFTVNGRICRTFNDVLTYEYIVELARMEGTPSMTMKGGYEGDRCLAPGDKVKPRTNSVFNVCHTGNA